MHENSDYKVTAQEPISSGFGKETTAQEVIAGVDLTGKVAIVTGGYSGVGLETTRALANAGASVVVPARSLQAASTAVAGIPRVEVEALDLINPASIDSFVERFLAQDKPLHILINNAGIMSPPLTRDSRGYESQFATNHLGHFQLTARLWPALKQANGARVVSLSSTGIRFGGVDFDDPNYERREYNKQQAYGQSKSATSLFAVALDRWGYADGVRAFAVHPGAVMSNLIRYMSEDELSTAKTFFKFKTAEQSAATSVWCATSRQLDGLGGVYCENVDIANILEANDVTEIPDGVCTWAIDPILAERLWQLSERLIGLKFLR
ncbi:SDR family NAD(P)-dependent oxidoreductase [Desulfosporosinus sp. OT]|uniref:SDR family NAD(P)-dependent oxidoreductase n=1 Tax=Desulfosporosinus sp. OT TaxID=913865 RepID=UPI000223AE2F|nr:SDR family NAD(P)-dependent oxidoreductase [Desulfosporosinus sp. OT]EGW36862.1 short chain dehydrogenase family protein [Desulfosporosinus sp. OT]